jgi:hypothetical protein
MHLKGLLNAEELEYIPEYAMDAYLPHLFKKPRVKL